MEDKDEEEHSGEAGDDEPWAESEDPSVDRLGGGHPVRVCGRGLGGGDGFGGGCWAGGVGDWSGVEERFRLVRVEIRLEELGER